MHLTIKKIQNFSNFLRGSNTVGEFFLPQTKVILRHIRTPNQRLTINAYYIKKIWYSILRYNPLPCFSKEKTVLKEKD